MKPFFQDAWATLYCGDCRAILPTLAPGSVDLVLTDPPYGVDLAYASYVDSFCEWEKIIAWLLREAFKVCNKTVLISTSKLESESYLFRHSAPLWRVCWYKGACSTRSAIGFKDWETIFVYGKPPKKQMHDYFYAGAGHNQVSHRGSHPCPKPIEWARWLCDKFSCDGDLILDPFAGSGTTLVAAKSLGRKSIGIEIEERYCAIAAKRLEQNYFDFPEDKPPRVEPAPLFLEGG